MADYIFTSSSAGAFTINVDGRNTGEPKGYWSCVFTDNSQQLQIRDKAGSNQSDVVYTIDLNTDTIDVDGVTSFADAQALYDALTPLFFLANSSGGGNQTLQQVTDLGNNTDNDIVLNDSRLVLLDLEGNEVGRLTQGEDPDFGLVLVAEDTKGARNKRLTLIGSNILLGTESLETVFNGAENGNILQLTGKKDVLGNDVFRVSSVPIKFNEFEETFTNALDVAITGAYSTAVNGITTFDYRPDTSYGDSLLYIENSSSSTATIEIGLAIGATTPAQTATYTIPRKQGSVNGVRIISTNDTFTTDLGIGDDIHVRIREVTATAGIIVKGTLQDSELKLVQTSSVRNATQIITSVSAPTPATELQIKNIYNLESGSDLIHYLPQALLYFNINDPVEIEVNNVSGTSKVIETTGADSIYAAGGTKNSLEIADGESYVFRCVSGTIWKILRSYQYDKIDRILALGDYSTNANFDSNPQTIVSQVLNYGFTRAKITVTFEILNGATNRSTACGIYLDGVLVADECEIEPKDSDNRYYQSKVFDTIVSTAPTLEVKYGRRGGGGGSMAIVGNVRIYVEKMNL